MGAAVRFGVLGPVTAWDADGREVPVRGSVQRTLLGVLLARRGDHVSGEWLVDALWPHEVPHHPGAALQSQVHRLRRSLTRDGQDDAVRLLTRGNGYVLAVPQNGVDAEVFEGLLADARKSLDAAPDRALTAVNRALDLWRGPPYADVEHTGAVQLEAVRLAEAHVLALELRGNALVQSGRVDEAVPLLEAFVTEHPLREGGRLSLLRALYATGRHADALAGYQDYRRRLADELGLEPGTAMRELEQDILRHEVVPPAPYGTATVPAVTGRLETIRVRYLPGPQGCAIAYGTAGDGPPLVSLPGWISSIDVIASGRDPRSSILQRLTASHAVVLYDRAGTGLSRGPVRDFGLAASVEELAAVVDAVGAPLDLLAMSQAGPVAVALAAARPELVRRLVLFGTYADGPSVLTNAEVRDSLLALVRAHWGMGSRLFADLYRPRMTGDAARHMGQVLRDSADADVAADYLEEVYRASAGDVLARVTVPALVLHYRGDRVIPFAGGQQLAAGLPDARFVALDGGYHLPDARDLDRIVREIDDFLTAGAS